MNEQLHTAKQVDFSTIRKDFPILERLVHGQPLVYLDNAASSQKPRQVIDAIVHFYEYYNANIHRGIHTLSQEGTELYEQSREKIRRFINAASTEEVIFTSGTTDAINTIAYSFAEKFLQPGDEIIISGMEHHSNFVPWQIVAERKGAVLKFLSVSNEGELIIDNLHELITSNTKIIAVNHVSNTLGTINPLKEIVRIAHTYNIPVLADGAQAVPHLEIDVQDLDCDFYAFSSHKMCGPTGIGILYGKKEWLEKLPPFKGGGEMIKEVTFAGTTYNDLPFKFEAGTPNIEGAIVLGTAVDYLLAIGMDQIAEREEYLRSLAMEALSEIDGIRFYGTAAHKAAVISFLVGNIHPYDMGVILDQLGIAVRTGHHCTQPLMDFYCIPGTVRASFAFYNNEEDVKRLVEGVKRAVKMLG